MARHSIFKTSDSGRSAEPYPVWKIKLVYRTSNRRHQVSDARYLDEFLNYMTWTWKFFIPGKGRDPGGYHFIELIHAKRRMALKVIREAKAEGHQVIIVRVNRETWEETIVWPKEDIPVLDRLAAV